MEKSTMTGLLLAAGIFAGTTASGAAPAIFLNVPVLLFTTGTALAIVMMQFPASHLLLSFRTLAAAMFQAAPDQRQISDQLRSWLSTARREGLQSLEPEESRVSDNFLREGLRHVLDQELTAKELESQLTAEIQQTEHRFEISSAVLRALAVAAPATGLAGTLIALMQLLARIDDPSAIGRGAAQALLSVLYGVVLSNVICLPLAGMLSLRGQQWVGVQQVIRTGLLAISEMTPMVRKDDRTLSFPGRADKADPGSSRGRRAA